MAKNTLCVSYIFCQICVWTTFVDFMNIQIAKKNDCFTVMVIIIKNFFLVVAFNDFVKM